jgi:WhiB family redox-sensing transcriptional regulator
MSARKRPPVYYGIEIAMPPGAWLDRAECSPDTAELFWPVGEEPGLAKQICRACPVIRECGRWALDNRITDGVWGGMGPGQLSRLAKSRTVRELLAEVSSPC